MVTYIQLFTYSSRQSGVRAAIMVYKCCYGRIGEGVSVGGAGGRLSGGRKHWCWASRMVLTGIDG